MAECQTKTNFASKITLTHHDMKRFAFLFVILLAVCSVHAQKVTKKGDVLNIDKVKYRITYTGKMVVDTLRSPYIYNESEMRLDIGNKVTHFYDRSKEIRDSILHEATIRGDYNFSSLPKGGRFAWVYYKNYPKEGESTFLESVIKDDYQCIEKVETPDWKIVSDSTATIMGYNCQLAKASFKGRTWYAWYSEDIPISEGPWKLCGLPGLILRAYDQSKQYIFDAIGMTDLKGSVDLTFNKIPRETISQKALRDARAKIDWTNLLNTMGASIKIVGADGAFAANKDVMQALKAANRKMKSNPIELE